MIENPVPQQFEENLARNLKPFNDFANRQTALTMDQVERQRHLQDVASSQTFQKGLMTQSESAEATAAKIANDRRMADYKEQMRLKEIDSGANEGANVTSDMTYEQAAAARKAKNKDVATATLESVDAQRKYYTDKQDFAYRSLIALSKNTGDEDQRRRALEATMRDPTISATLNSDDRDFINGTLTAQKDPKVALAMVDSYLKKAYGGSGLVPWTKKPATSTGANDRANNFSAYFQANLEKIVNPEKADQIATLQTAYRDANVQSDAFNLKARDTLAMARRWLPKESLDEYSKSWGFESNPFDKGKDKSDSAIDPATGQLRAPGSAPGTTPAVTDPSATATPAPVTPATVTEQSSTLPPIGEQNSIASDIGSRAWNVTKNIGSAVLQPFSNIAQVGSTFIPGTENNQAVASAIGLPPNAPAPTPAQISAGRAARDYRMSQNGLPPNSSLTTQQRPPATPDELEKVRQLYMQKTGQTNDQMVSNIKTLHSTDPKQSTAIFNSLLNEVRGGSVNSETNLPPVAVPQY